MLVGGNQSPYRAPCAGTVLCGLGPRYQHAKADEKNIEVWLYNGVVPDWATEGGFIAPYERYNPENACSGGVLPECAGEDVCPDPTSSAPPCLAWMGDSSADANGCWFSYQAGAPNPPPDSWYQPQMLTAVGIVNGGENYRVGDVLWLDGGTLSNYIGPNGGSAGITVGAVNESGAITAVTISNAGSYSALPSSPNAVTGGHGTGAQLALTFGNQMMSMAVCFKYGFKNVQAMRQWHGAFGLVGNNGGGELYSCTATDPISGLDVTCFSLLAPYSNTAAQSKYTTISGSCTYSETDASDDDGGENAWTDTYAMTSQVDPMTGRLSQSGAVTGHEADVNSGLALFQLIASFVSSVSDWFGNAIACVLYGTETQSSCVGYVFDYFQYGNAPPGSCEAVDNYIDDNGDTVYYKSYEINFGDGTWATYGVTYDEETGYGNGTQQLYNGTFSISDSGLYTSYQIASDYNGEAGTLFSYAQITDNSFDYYFSFSPFAGTDQEPTTGALINQTISCSISFSGSNTAADVQADMKMLLDYWDLTDDTLYPWRTDPYTSVAPLVTRNEVRGNVAPTYYVGVGSYTDPNAAYYDDTILGRPMPAGYQGAFDFGYVDFEVCDTLDPPGLVQVGWGQGNTGQNGIPLNATQWTNLNLASQFSGGAWMFYMLNPNWEGCGSPTPGTVCIAQKWAETKMGFASQNFFRPAGNDRFAYDEGNVYSISATANTGHGPNGDNQGAQITLEQTDTCSAEVSTGTSGLWGGPAVGGFYKIASAAGNVVTLGELVYALPSNWQSASNDDDFCFGLLRFSAGNPATDPPAILGRAAISAVAEYEGNPAVTELTTVSLPTLGLIQAGIGYDKVDIYDSQMNLLASDYQISRIDDSHFTLPYETTLFAGAAWMMSHGAPAYYWNDQYPKGDYAYTDWTWWPRLICEAARINEVSAGCTGTTGCTDCPDTVTQYQYPFSAFTQEAGCVAFNPCNPAVLCISPNGESFPNGTTYGFPAIEFDEQYGSGWQAEFQQVMTDLLYQSPHYPAMGANGLIWDSASGSWVAGTGCAATPFQWIPDDGSCSTYNASAIYFPHPPMVECRITLPGGVPALPSSPETCGVPAIVIGWTSPVNIASGDCTPANTLTPPSANGLDFAATAWGLWQNECDCIGAGGAFAAEYGNTVGGCS